MAERVNGPDRTISTETAHAILARASELDAVTDSSLTVSQLREAAREAGISTAAFDQALGDGRATERARPPLWIRICLSGVPTRRAAMLFFYGYFASVIAVVAAGLVGRLPVASAAVVAVFLTFAGWSTGEAVRWQDRRGWDPRE